MVAGPGALGAVTDLAVITGLVIGDRVVLVADLRVLILRNYCVVARINCEGCCRAT